MRNIWTFLTAFLLLSTSVYAEKSPYSVDPVTGKTMVPVSLLKEIASNTVKDLANWELLSDLEKADEINPSLGETFSFPEADAALKKTIFITDSENAAPAPPPPGGDNMQDLLVDIGSGDYSQVVQNARNVIDHAIGLGNFITTLTGEDLISLPVVIEQEIGNITARIVFNSITLKPTHTELEVFAGVDIPQKAKTGAGGSKDISLMFSASGIEISQDGGIQGVGTLMLLSDIAFELGGSNSKAAIVLNKGYWVDDSDAPEGRVAKGTFVTFGCSGVQEFGLGATIHFSKDWVLPADEFGHVNEDGSRVTAAFEIRVQDWNNLLVENIELSHFVPTKFQKVSLYVGNANLDLSDYGNPTTLVFPPGYEAPPVINLWRGVYIEAIELTLPSPFKRKCDGFGYEDEFGLDESVLLADAVDLNIDENEYEPDPYQYSLNQAFGGPAVTDYVPEHLNEKVSEAVTEQCRIKISANDLIIDKSGVTGYFAVSGEAPLLGGGQMNKKWSWSLDEIGIGIMQNDFVEFGFSGVIAVPITDDSTPLRYTGGINFAQDDPIYTFSVGLEEELTFPIFNAGSVNLYGGTTIEVTYDANTEEFKPVMTLYGNLSIGNQNDYANSSTGSEAQLPSIEFLGLRVQTDEAYCGIIEGGQISISSGEAKVMNFPVSISDISLINVEGGEESKVKLGFTINLNLMKPSDGGFAAEGSFFVHGKLNSDINGSHRWAYDGFTFGGAQISLDLPKFKACGTLVIFNDDPIYGNGFAASVSAEVMGESSVSALCSNTGPLTGKFHLSMSAIFGSKDDYRYFLFDGFAGGDLIKVPLPPTPLFLNGFGGGVFHHMKPTGFNDPNSAAGGGGDGESALGTDTSGIIYSPTPSTKLGIKFAVGLTAAANTMNGKLTCILRFGQGMSLQNITFWGVVDFVNPMPDLPSVETPDIVDRMSDIGEKTEEQMHSEDAAAAANVPEDKINLKLGISLDFEDSDGDGDGDFALHGFAEAFISVGEGAIQGTGTLDLLIDPTNDLFHLYLGAYRSPAVEVPAFFGDDGSTVQLYPVSVSLDYAGINVTADAYMMLGNDIPGPPDIHPAAAAYFADDTEEPSDNRDLLYEGDRSPVSGTGIAFGASMLFEFEKKVKTFGVTLLNVNVNGGLGFDISLLVYPEGSRCENDLDADDHGVNYFRATGNIWAFVNASGRILVVPIPPIGVGVMLTADIPDPGYFQAVVVINFIKKFRFDLEIGDEPCGTPVMP